MTQTATQQVISNGPRNLVLKYTIAGNAPFGDVTADTLVDISSLDANIGVGGYRLEKASWSLTGMSAKLAWEGAADVDLIQLSSGDGAVDFSETGGIVNNASIPTGNVVYTTTGFGTTGDGGSMVLEFKKKSRSAAIAALEADVGTASMSIAGQSITVSGFYNPIIVGAPAAQTIAGQSITVSGFYNPIAVGAPAAMAISSEAPTVTNA